MLSRLSSVVVSAVSFALLATATPWGTTPPATVTVTTTAPGTTSTATSCSTGPVQCCNQVQAASGSTASALLGLLGIVLSDINTPIGINCSPITIVGIAGNDCSAQTVCCQNNSFSGIIAIGCTPINIAL